jgi:hypothetical protein
MECTPAEFVVVVRGHFPSLMFAFYFLKYALRIVVDSVFTGQTNPFPLGDVAVKIDKQRTSEEAAMRLVAGVPHVIKIYHAMYDVTIPAHDPCAVKLLECWEEGLPVPIPQVRFFIA